MKDTTSILDRIKIAAKTESDYELARKLNLSKQAIANARSTNSVPPAWIPKIAQLCNVSTDWLFFGTEMPIQSATASKTERVQQEKQDIVWIPLVEAVLSAGAGSLETGGDYEREYAFRLDFISRKGDPKNMVLMRVAGDSMSPEIMHNDVVLIDTSKTAITPGHMYAVNFEDAIYLKRIDKVPGKVILKSTNAAYENIELCIQDQTKELLRIIGRVLWCGREYH